MANLFSRLLGGNAAQPASQPQALALPSIGANINIPAAAAPAQQPQRRGPSLIDTLFGAAAGYSPGATALKFEQAQREAEIKRQQQQALQGVAAMFGGQPQGMGAAPQGVGGPTGAPQGAAMSSSQQFDPRRFAPALAGLAAGGVDIGNLKGLVEMSRPDVEIINGVAVDRRDVSNIGKRVGGVSLDNVNGLLIDPNDPRNTGRFVPQVEAGMEVVYDAQGRPMVRPVEGYNAARAGTIAAETSAQEGARSGYQTITTTGPRGEPVTMRLSDFLQGGTVAGPSPVDQARDIDEAKSDVQLETDILDQAGNVPRRRAAVAEMRQLLPDIISGPLADQRLAAARALALTGNEEARRKVAATEIFRNQGRALVLDIIKTLGANPTDADREYLNQMSGADVNITPEALSRGLELEEAALNRLDQRAAGIRQSRASPGRGGGQVDRAGALAELRRRGVIR